MGYLYNEMIRQVHRVKEEYMNIGAFSLSLAVKNIEASLAFYEKIGFEKFFGNIDEKWLILKNGDVTIGIFEGMFEKNLMTFNPGWDDSAKDVDPYTDVRKLQKDWKAKGINIIDEVDESTEGPGSFFIEDPDGNQILIDQHR